jgi:hypothetical protein
LFVFTTDEQDHFAGGTPSPAGCDGVTTPCTYSQIGEVNVNVAGLLATQQSITTPFTVHSDSAPNFYLQGNPGAYTDEARNFERAADKLTATNPYTAKTEQIANYLADPTEMAILHMVTADAARTPTFTMFAKPDYFLFAGKPNCASPCVQIQAGFAWNHGTVSPDINTTWLGLVGPGVLHLGTDSTTWADETDIRPTMLALVGLKDDYQHDGRVLLEDIDPVVLPTSITADRSGLTQLGAVYKQLNADVGRFDLATLAISTTGMESDTPQDSAFRRLDAQLQQLRTERDSTASQMKTLLDAAAFGGQTANIGNLQELISRGNALLDRADAMAKAVSS